ncbi:acyl carrier protein [Crossiella sp. CA198]|uniref:acyl carrier protein n=1 Tax=Crossiella sp. CA198 TaxID=3455607 RepID=UPI003F8D33A2
MNESGSRVSKSVAEAGREALGADAPMAGANFFELGGDSLAAAKMADGLSTDLGVEVPAELIFDADDLQDLAAKLAARLNEPAP